MTDPSRFTMVHAAAVAAAAALPLLAAATVGEPTPVDGQDLSELLDLLPAGASLLVVANGEHPAAFAVVLGSALVQVFGGRPPGAPEIAAVFGPALAVAAGALNATAGPAHEIGLSAAVGELFGRGQAFLVPLTHEDGSVCATMVIVPPTDSAAVTPESEPVDRGRAHEARAAEPDVPSARLGLDMPTPAPLVPTAPAPDPIDRLILDRAADVAASQGSRPQELIGLGLELLRDLLMEVTVHVGRIRMTISELLSLTPGAVLELDRAAGSPADLLVNGTLLARGEIVIVEEDFGIRITEIVGAGAEAMSAPRVSA